MHFLPILSTLRRHRTAAALIILEIALTCAIVCNAVFLVGERLSRMDQPSGIVEDEILRIRFTGVAARRPDAAAIVAADLAALRALPGVKFTAATNMVPFGDSSSNTDISTVHDDPKPQANAALYLGTQDLIETLGVQLIAGRDFLPEEYADFEAVQTGKAQLPSVIITRGVADKLYPGTSALGKPAYVWGKEPQTIVGIIDHLARPNTSTGIARPEYAMIVPITLASGGGNYLLRVDPSRRAEILAAVDATLDKVDPSRIILDRQTFPELRAKHFRKDRAMAWLLVGVCVALLIVTALGVIGLASFWVQQRTRQIGVRRALGATRGDIVRYFQAENFILASLGIVIGMVLAYAINQWLMNAYEVARMPAQVLPVGAAILWLIGQIAVLGPALRASLIPPALATRTV